MRSTQIQKMLKILIFRKENENDIISCWSKPLNNKRSKLWATIPYFLFFNLSCLAHLIQFLWVSGKMLSVCLLTERQVERRQNDGEETPQREKNGKTLTLTWNRSHFPLPWSWSRNSSQYSLFPSLQSKCLSLISGTEKTGVTVSKGAEETGGGYGVKGPSGNPP